MACGLVSDIVLVGRFDWYGDTIRIYLVRLRVLVGLRDQCEFLAW